jgi:hypothetical protein
MREMRKLRATLEFVLQQAEEGKLGAYEPGAGCAYEDSAGKHCAIGGLLTPQELEDVCNEGLNTGTSVGALTRPLGEDFLERNGLSLRQAYNLQQLHDYTVNETGGIGRFVADLRKVLAYDDLDAGLKAVFLERYPD